MKNKTTKIRLVLIIALAHLLINSSIFSQAPQKMSYQAIIRNSNDSLLVSTPVGMRISLVQSSPTGAVVYSETQTVTTNANGLVSLQIGMGTVVSGTFAGIDWAAGPYYVKTETDLTGGTNYTIISSNELLSVPYALFSANAIPGPLGPQGIAGTNGNDGATGPQGNQGPQGIAGTNGNDGATGPAGTQGPIGLTGPSGASGSTGLTGAAGTNGATGPQGPIGLTGPAGTNGATGAVGASGSQGIAGIEGGGLFTFSSSGFNYFVGGFANAFPTLTLVRGQLYYFNWSAVSGSHPIALRLSNGSTAAVPGTTNNNPTTGQNSTSTLTTYRVPLDAPSSIVYQCVFHSGMIGTINIVNQNGTAGATGATGSIGLTGPAGTNGTNGAVGATGPAGPQGPIGLTGPSGSSGSTGLTGPAGSFPPGTVAGEMNYWNGTAWVTVAPGLSLPGNQALTLSLCNGVPTWGPCPAALPTVTTTAVFSITNFSASSGGAVTSNGGATVSAWGVCWSTSANPTLANSFIQNTVSSGSFSSALSGLAPNTTYYVRAYATNSAGTAYGNQVSFTTANLLAIGQSYQGGKVAYILQAGDIGYNATVPHGLIAAPSDQGSAQWGCYGTLISGADGIAIGTGAQNTIDIMNGCNTAGIAARLCGDLVLGGYSDWYLPSKDELNQLYINRVAIGGFASSFYWSSTEANYDSAWWHYFGFGAQSDYDKNDYDGTVRAVRAF